MRAVSIDVWCVIYSTESLDERRQIIGGIATLKWRIFLCPCESLIIKAAARFAMRTGVLSVRVAPVRSSLLMIRVVPASVILLLLSHLSFVPFPL